MANIAEIPEIQQIFDSEVEIFAELLRANIERQISRASIPAKDKVKILSDLKIEVFKTQNNLGAHFKIFSEQNYGMLKRASINVIEKWIKSIGIHNFEVPGSPFQSINNSLLKFRKIPTEDNAARRIAWGIKKSKNQFIFPNHFYYANLYEGWYKFRALLFEKFKQAAERQLAESLTK